MKTVFLSTFLAVFILFDNSLGFTATSAWWTHLTYNFQHANIWHLLVNSVAFWCVFKSLERHIPPYKIITISLAVAIIASFIPPFYETPTVGASGMIYAMIGILVSITLPPYIFLFTKVPTSPNKSPMVFRLLFWLSCIALMLTVGFFLPNSAGLLHLYCFVGGFSLKSLPTLLSFYKLKTSKI